MKSAVRCWYFAAVALASYSASSFGSTADSAGAGAMFYSLLTSLTLILGVAAAAALILRRWKGAVGRRQGPLRLEYVIALGPRERLALVRVGARYLVVGVTPTSISKLAEFSGPLLEPPGPTAAPLIETTAEAPRAAQAR